MDGWTDRQIERNETKKIVTMLPPPPPSSPFFLKTHTEKEKKNSNAILFFTSMLVINDANAAAAANTYCRIQTFIANIFFLYYHHHSYTELIWLDYNTWYFYFSSNIFFDLISFPHFKFSFFLIQFGSVRFFFKF